MSESPPSPIPHPPNTHTKSWIRPQSLLFDALRIDQKQYLKLNIQKNNR